MSSFLSFGHMVTTFIVVIVVVLLGRYFIIDPLRIRVKELEEKKPAKPKPPGPVYYDWIPLVISLPITIVLGIGFAIGGVSRAWLILLVVALTAVYAAEKLHPRAWPNMGKPLLRLVPAFLGGVITANAYVYLEYGLPIGKTIMWAVPTTIGFVLWYVSAMLLRKGRIVKPVIIPATKEKVKKKAGHHVH